jgi:hypothetical protein
MAGLEVGTTSVADAPEPPEQEQGTTPEPPPEFPPFTKAVAFALFMIPIGGLLLMVSGNAVLYSWLEITPKMSYGEACGVMCLAWMIRFFMYR